MDADFPPCGGTGRGVVADASGVRLRHVAQQSDPHGHDAADADGFVARATRAPWRFRSADCAQRSRRCFLGWVRAATLRESAANFDPVLVQRMVGSDSTSPRPTFSSPGMSPLGCTSNGDSCDGCVFC